MIEPHSEATNPIADEREHQPIAARYWTSQKGRGNGYYNHTSMEAIDEQLTFRVVRHCEKLTRKLPFKDRVLFFQSNCIFSPSNVLFFISFRFQQTSLFSELSSPRTDWKGKASSWIINILIQAAHLLPTDHDRIIVQRTFVSSSNTAFQRSRATGPVWEARRMHWMWLSVCLCWEVLKSLFRWKSTRTNRSFSASCSTSVERATGYSTPL